MTYYWYKVTASIGDYILVPYYDYNASYGWKYDLQEMANAERVEIFAGDNASFPAARQGFLQIEYGQLAGGTNDTEYVFSGYNSINNEFYAVLGIINYEFQFHSASEDWQIVPELQGIWEAVDGSYFGDGITVGGSDQYRYLYPSVYWAYSLRPPSEPVAVDDHFEFLPGDEVGSTIGNALLNDYDPDGPDDANSVLPQTHTLSNGAVVQIYNGGDIVVVEGPAYSSLEQIPYTIVDATGLTSEGRILIDFGAGDDELPVAIPLIATAQLARPEFSSSSPFIIQAVGNLVGYDPDETDIVSFDLSPGQDPRLHLNSDGSFSFVSDVCIYDTDGIPDYVFEIRLTDDEGNEVYSTLSIIAPPKNELLSLYNEIDGQLKQNDEAIEQVAYAISEFIALDEFKAELAEASNDLKTLLALELTKYGLSKVLNRPLQTLVEIIETAIAFASDGPSVLKVGVGAVEAFSSFLEVATSGANPFKGGAYANMIKALDAASEALGTTSTVRTILDIKNGQEYLSELYHQVESDQIGRLLPFSDRFEDEGDIFDVGDLLADAQRFKDDLDEYQSSLSDDYSWLLNSYADGSDPVGLVF